MRFTEEKRDYINNALCEEYVRDVKINYDGTGIVRNGMVICNLYEVGKLVEELNVLKEVVEKEMGIIL